MMRFVRMAAVACLLAGMGQVSAADADPRERVELPEMMQQHMMANMRDHLAAIDEILSAMASGESERAAEIAESRLGMSSLTSHGADHMGRFMPQGMREAGMAMHRAATAFALKAQEGDLLPAYGALSAVTSACVGCHAGYRIH